MQPARSLARHPLFQVMLEWRDTPGAEPALPGLRVNYEPLTLPVAKFDMTLGLGERLGPGGEPRGIRGGLEFSRDLFDEGTVQAMATRLVRLLEAAVRSPDLPVRQLAILGAAERHMVLQGFNATVRPVPAATLLELFAAQVERLTRGRRLL